MGTIPAIERPCNILEQPTNRERRPCTTNIGFCDLSTRPRFGTQCPAADCGELKRRRIISQTGSKGIPVTGMDYFAFAK
jgi:hypothetical protein